MNADFSECRCFFLGLSQDVHAQFADLSTRVHCKEKEYCASEITWIHQINDSEFVKQNWSVSRIGNLAYLSLHAHRAFRVWFHELYLSYVMTCLLSLEDSLDGTTPNSPHFLNHVDQGDDDLWHLQQKPHHRSPSMCLTLSHHPPPPHKNGVRMFSYSANSVFLSLLSRFVSAWLHLKKEVKPSTCRSSQPSLASGCLNPLLPKPRLV